MRSSLAKIEIGEIVKSEGREFTRVYGGFGEGMPIMTTKQIAELLGYDLRVVNQTIERNMDHFTEDLDIVDLKKIITDSDHLLNMGYSKVAVGRAKSKFYGLSKAGFILYLKFAEGDKAVELYKNFIESYFKTQARVEELESTLEEELEYLNDQKATSLGRMFMEQNEVKKMELFNDVEKINGRIAELRSKLDNKEIQKALDKQTKLTENKAVYVNQTDFGASFNLKIGSKTVGKLFKVVGLAMKSRSSTTPYERYVPKYAQSIVNQDTSRVTYKWNYDECYKHIDSWLRDRGLYEKFYSITDKKTLGSFINVLHDDMDRGIWTA